MPIVTANYSDIDHDKLAATMGLKKHYIAMLLESFKEESDILLNALHVAIEAVEYANIRCNAHAIKGSAGNMRFEAVYEMAKEMELAASACREDFEYKIYFHAIKSAIETIS